MPKPPSTPPHSDLDGVNEDEVRNTQAAHEAGQDTGDLERASKQDRARPAYGSDASDDDRSR